MRHLLGLLAFAVAIAIGIGVTYLVRTQSEPASPANPQQQVESVPDASEPPEPPTPARADDVAPELAVSITQITLDRSKRQSVARLLLRTEGDGAPPERVWVWTAFFVPGSDEVFSADPVEVPWPDSTSGDATVEVVTPTPWLSGANSDNGYYARIVASAISSRDAVPDRPLTPSHQGAVPVLMLGSERSGR